MAEWRPVDGWPGYEVSADGGVLSRRRREPRVLKPVLNAGRYYVSLSNGPTRKLVALHILVCAAFHGPRPEGKWACHRNGLTFDNRAENLYWGTPTDNNRDTVKHGRNRNAAKVRCGKGHEFTDANTRRTKSGRRACRRCHAERERERRALARPPLRDRHATVDGVRLLERGCDTASSAQLDHRFHLVPASQLPSVGLSAYRQARSRGDELLPASPP